MRTLACCLLAMLAVRSLAAEPPPAPRVRFGIQTPNQDTNWDDILAAWKEAEALWKPSASASFHAARMSSQFVSWFGVWMPKRTRGAGGGSAASDRTASMARRQHASVRMRRP